MQCYDWREKQFLVLGNLGGGRGQALLLGILPRSPSHRTTLVVEVEVSVTTVDFAKRLSITAPRAHPIQDNASMFALKSIIQN